MKHCLGTLFVLALCAWRVVEGARVEGCNAQFLAKEVAGSCSASAPSAACCKVLKAVFHRNYGVTCAQLVVQQPALKEIHLGEQHIVSMHLQCTAASIAHAYSQVQPIYHPAEHTCAPCPQPPPCPEPAPCPQPPPCPRPRARRCPAQKGPKQCPLIPIPPAPVQCPLIPIPPAPVQCPPPPPPVYIPVPSPAPACPPPVQCPPPPPPVYIPVPSPAEEESWITVLTKRFHELIALGISVVGLTAVVKMNIREFTVSRALSAGCLLPSPPLPNLTLPCCSRCGRCLVDGHGNDSDETHLLEGVVPSDADDRRS